MPRRATSPPLPLRCRRRSGERLIEGERACTRARDRPDPWAVRFPVDLRTPGVRNSTGVNRCRLTAEERPSADNGRARGLASLGGWHRRYGLLAFDEPFAARRPPDARTDARYEASSSSRMSTR